MQAADIAGMRALAVHAKDDAARTSYERFDFLASPTDPHHLFLLIKDVRATLERATSRGHDQRETASPDVDEGRGLPEPHVQVAMHPPRGQTRNVAGFV